MAGKTLKGKSRPPQRDDKGRFVKGVSGNPQGRCINTEGLSGLLQEMLELKKPGIDKAHKRIVLERLILEAEAGNLNATRIIFAYMDGLPVQRVQQQVSGSLSSDPAWILIRTKLLQMVTLHPEIKADLEGILDGYTDRPEDGD